MPAMTAAIGIDVGTTNVKVALVRGDGTLAGRAHRNLTTARAGDTAEQDADVMWAALVDATRELTTAHPDVAREVVAFGVCTQYSSIVPVDANARPIAPMLMWQDQRGTDHSFEIMARDEGAFMTWVERHGIPTIGSGLSLGHILHVQLDRPDLHARAAAYLEPMDYVTARATGRITATQHSTYMFQLCDNRTLGATAYDDDLVKLAGVDPEKLPPLITIDAAVGPLLPAVAAELGLPEATIVYAGTNDTVTVAIAAGAFTAGRGGLAIGTTSVMVDEVGEFRVDLEHQLFSMPGPFPDRYVVCAENGLGGKVVEHVLHNMVYASDELGAHDVDDEFAQLDSTLAATTPGAGAVLFLPWLSGSMAPAGDSAMRGGFVNMSLETDRRSLVRATVEGTAHNLRWLLPHVETFTGRSIDELALVGGAGRSPEWCAILADVLDRPVLALTDPATAVARATALLALQRHGALTRADLDTDVPIAHRDDPRPEYRDLYAARHTQFEAAYAALLPISEALQ